MGVGGLLRKKCTHVLYGLIRVTFFFTFYVFGSSLRKGLREPETFSLRHPFRMGLYTKYWNRMAYIIIDDVI